MQYTSAVGTKKYMLSDIADIFWGEKIITKDRQKSVTECRIIRPYNITSAGLNLEKQGATYCSTDLYNKELKDHRAIVRVGDILIRATGKNNYTIVNKDIGIAIVSHNILVVRLKTSYQNLLRQIVLSSEWDMLLQKGEQLDIDKLSKAAFLIEEKPQLTLPFSSDEFLPDSKSKHKFQKMSLQDALCLSYIEDNRCVTKEHIDNFAYLMWETSLTALYEAALNEYGKKMNPGYDEAYSPVYDSLKQIIKLIGDVNGFPLSFDSLTGKLIIDFCYPQKQEYENFNVSREDLFRIRLEHYLGRCIQLQRLKTQSILIDEQREKHFRRRVDTTLRKRRNIQESEISEQIIDNNKSETENKLDVPICGLESILYIYKGQIRCVKDHHELVSATAKLFGRKDNEIMLNVEYCKLCKKYLLEYGVYEEYRKKYGVLIGNLKLDSADSLNGDYDLALESPLKLSGYSVGQKDGYSIQERQYILAQIIHNHIMSKRDVIRYLSYFIKMNGSRSGNEYALSKWQEDLQFVQQYNINIQPSTIIREIKKY